MKDLLISILFGECSPRMIADSSLSNKEIEELKDKIPFWYNDLEDKWDESSLKMFCNQALVIRNRKEVD